MRPYGVVKQPIEVADFRLTLAELPARIAGLRYERLRDDASMQLGEKQQRLIATTTRAVAAPGPEPLP